MAGTLNMKAYQQLFNEDIEWLQEQERTLEREHIRDCLVWMRDHKHQIEAAEASRDRRAANATKLAHIRLIQSLHASKQLTARRKREASTDSGEGGEA